MKIKLMSVLFVLSLSSPIMAAESGDGGFDKLDTNHDNVVSKKEFVDSKVKVDRGKAIELFPDMRDLDQKNDRALKESLFDRMDSNRDGLLSRDEWRRVAPNILQIPF